MPSMKRPAAAAQPAKGAAAKVPAAKKARTVDPNLATYQVIADTIKSADGFPSDVLNALAGVVKVSLSRPKAERHSFAESWVTMMEEVLKSIDTAARGKVEALEAQVGASDAQRASREAEATAAQAREEVCGADLEAAKAKLAAAVEETLKAKTALQDASKAQKAALEEFDAAGARKTRLEAAEAGEYAALKEAPSAKAAKALLKAIQGLGFDANLLHASESSLSKPEAERGTFDHLVVKQMDAAFEENLKGLAEQLSRGEPVRAEHAASVAAATADADARAEEERVARAAIGDAQAALASAVTDRKAAARALKDFGPEMKRVAAELAAARKGLEEALSVVASFEALRDAVPPAPEAEAEAEAEAPAAEREAEAAAVEEVAA